MICPNVILNILEQIEVENDILQTVGMALLTVLIPAAIAIFEDRKGFEVLDTNVILDHIVEAKRLFIYLTLVFLPLLFWTLSPAWLRFVELISWALGIFFVARMLARLYKWMKGDKFSLRLKYLGELLEPHDLEASWRSVWESKEINTENERRFLNLFFEKIDNLLDRYA